LFDRRKKINETYLWQGTDLSTVIANVNVSKNKGEGQQAISSGNVELV